MRNLLKLFSPLDQLAGLAPGPFAGSKFALSSQIHRRRATSYELSNYAVVLADFGADVVRVDRKGTVFNMDVLSRYVFAIFPCSISLTSFRAIEASDQYLSPSNHPRAFKSSKPS